MVKVIMSVLIAIAGLGFGGGIAGYQMLIAPAVSLVSDGACSAAEYQSHNERVDNSRPYSPPAGTELTEAQLQRLLATQSDIRDALAGRLDQLQGRGADASERCRGQGADRCDRAGHQVGLGGLAEVAKRPGWRFRHPIALITRKPPCETRLPKGNLT